MSRFMDAFLSSMGYEGVTHAGILLVSRRQGRMLLIQRAFDEDDAPDVQETWEFPGGGLEEGEEPLAGALREVEEETGLPVGPHEVVHGWRAGEDGHYQGFVVAVAGGVNLDLTNPDPDEVQDIGWFTPDEASSLNLRPEVAALDLAALVAHAVSGNEEKAMADEEIDLSGVEELVATEPVLTMADIAFDVIPVHGVLCPEDTASGDGRGFNADAVTTRPLRLPFRFQRSDIGGHDGAVTVGSIDRVMRKDGLIQWEGTLITSIQETGELLDLLLHFGRYGVSIDGDQGGLDAARSKAEGMTWFDAVRIAGTTAVGIPAFHEAYVALGPHPEMPLDQSPETLIASGLQPGDIIGQPVFDRGPGWVTNPKETKRLHDYWTKPGQPGYQKINWGNGGDYRRCVTLVGEKIAKNSPEDTRYIKQICAQWHHDALGYWPGELGKPGNNPKTALAEAVARLDNEGLTATDDGTWESVLVSSAGMARPPLHYFHEQSEHGAFTVSEPDENGFRHVYGFAATWGVCHIGMSGRCVEPPRTYSNDYPQFHMGKTRTDEGYIPTGVLTYGVGHRDAETILSESPEQAYFDNINNAWAAVRVGENSDGIWFSGVVLPGVPEEHLVKIEASGQVSGEWIGEAMRACLTVNVPGFGVEQPSAIYDDEGNVLAMAASAFGGMDHAPCADDPRELMAAAERAYVESQFETLQASWKGN